MENAARRVHTAEKEEAGPRPIDVMREGEKALPPICEREWGNWPKKERHTTEVCCARGKTKKDNTKFKTLRAGTGRESLQSWRRREIEEGIISGGKNSKDEKFPPSERECSMSQKGALVFKGGPIPRKKKSAGG